MKGWELSAESKEPITDPDQDLDYELWLVVWQDGRVVLSDTEEMETQKVWVTLGMLEIALEQARRIHGQIQPVAK